ncbi:hypothetical protein AGMMS49975_08650 [Clostridia bacterium]|nr:hypothetical protein AGMMS49975_08650 [Clostridia bacterium]GHU77272.1 hypothetical protein FACS1894188_11230 [Clostridia bacterium]
MIQLVAGEKGSGKTKILIDLVNKSVEKTDGHLVFIDKDKGHMYDLQYNIRFVETESFHLANFGEFAGFIYGIVSQDNDIKEIYVDNLSRIVTEFTDGEIETLVLKLTKLSDERSIDFIIGLSLDADALPESLKKLVI